MRLSCRPKGGASSFSRVETGSFPLPLDAQEETQRLIYEENLRHLISFAKVASTSTDDAIQKGPESWTFLDGILKEIASTGRLRYPWRMVKILWIRRFEKVIEQLAKKVPLADGENETRRTITTAVEIRKTAPFTLQRLSELVLHTADPHKRSLRFMRPGRFMFAVSKNVFGVLSCMPEQLPDAAWHFLSPMDVNPQQDLRRQKTPSYDEWVRGVSRDEAAALKTECGKRSSPNKCVGVPPSKHRRKLGTHIPTHSHAEDDGPSSSVESGQTAARQKRSSLLSESYEDDSPGNEGGTTDPAGTVF